MGEITINRRAYFDYEVLETYEAGVELRGFEVKAVKTGHINLPGSFVVIKDGEACPHTKRHSRCGVGAWLLNATIPPYQPKNAPPDYNPTHTRRLLLHKSEIKELIGATVQKGLTIVPLKVYTKHNRVKILIGLARHKRKADKRELIRKRDTEKEIKRTLKWG